MELELAAPPPPLSPLQQGMPYPAARVGAAAGAASFVNAPFPVPAAPTSASSASTLSPLSLASASAARDTVLTHPVASTVLAQANVPSESSQRTRTAAVAAASSLSLFLHFLLHRLCLCRPLLSHLTPV